MVTEPEIFSVYDAMFIRSLDLETRAEGKCTEEKEKDVLVQGCGVAAEKVCL